MKAFNLSFATVTSLVIGHFSDKLESYTEKFN